MATVQITWDDINDNEDGFHIYRSTSPLDTANPENLPAPLASVAAGIGSYDDTTAAAGTTYYYAVAAYKGSFVNPAVDIEVSTAFVEPDYSSAQAGDEIGGGIYTGIHTVASVDYHYIVTKADQIVSGNNIQWSDSGVSGATSVSDGLANQQIMLGLTNLNPELFIYADGLTIGGHSDWYVPAYNEVEHLEQTVSGLAEYSSIYGENVGTSTEVNTSGFRYCTSFDESITTYFNTSKNNPANINFLFVRRVPV